MAFNPRNGLLYAAVGDGGGSGDPENDAQNVVRNRLGKVLRINVDGTGAGQYGTYSIPSSNPFVGRSGRDEIWSYGFRNPWRLSFDRANGNLFIADVGQGSWEEVDRETYGAAGGRNYGWRIDGGTPLLQRHDLQQVGQDAADHRVLARQRQVLDHRRLRLPRHRPRPRSSATTSSPTSAAGDLDDPQHRRERRPRAAGRHERA